jgi:hypothetical protein
MNTKELCDMIVYRHDDYLEWIKSDENRKMRDTIQSGLENDIINLQAEQCNLIQEKNELLTGKKYSLPLN